MRHNVDYDKTYAPVTSWDTVHLMLILSLVHKWESCQIDYVSAFPQSPIGRPTYTRIPPGLKVPGDPSNYALYMHRNLYGRKQSGRIWYQYLTDRLKGIGFIQSDHDPCVFFCKG